MPVKAAPRAAALDDKVSDGTGVRTGDQSRSELTFVDQTITRLNQNTVFRFHNGGHTIDLGSGTVLFSVPKNSGGGQIRTGVATVAITGTSVIVDSLAGGRNRLIGLEGSARYTLNKFPKETAVVKGGQMLDVPAGATKLPPVQNIDLNDLMKTHPLITNFRPLPSRDLIYATQKSPPAATGGGQGPGLPPILGDLIRVGVGIPLGGGGHTTHRGGRHKGKPGHSDGSDSMRRSGSGKHKPGMKTHDSSSSAHEEETTARRKKKKPGTY